MVDGQRLPDHRRAPGGLLAALLFFLFGGLSPGPLFWQFAKNCVAVIEQATVSMRPWSLFKGCRLARMSDGHYCLLRDLGPVKGGRGMKHLVDVSVDIHTDVRIALEDFRKAGASDKTSCTLRSLEDHDLHRRAAPRSDQRAVDH
jgi:hypothetical protein